MAKNYEVEKSYYLPVKVSEKVSDVVNAFIKLVYLDGVNNDHLMINDKPDLLLTEYEIAEKVHFRRNRERDAEIVTLKSENERLSKQNEELGAKVDNLETELNSARSLNEFAVKTEQTREKLITEQRELIKKYGMVIDILLDKITALKKGENNG